MIIRPHSCAGSTTTGLSSTLPAGSCAAESSTRVRSPPPAMWSKLGPSTAVRPIATRGSSGTCITDRPRFGTLGRQGPAGLYRGDRPRPGHQRDREREGGHIADVVLGDRHVGGVLLALVAALEHH